MIFDATVAIEVEYLEAALLHSFHGLIARQLLFESRGAHECFERCQMRVTQWKCSGVSRCYETHLGGRDAAECVGRGERSDRNSDGVTESPEAGRANYPLIRAIWAVAVEAGGALLILGANRELSET